jgi:tRNA(Ile)-lysidine synthase
MTMAARPEHRFLRAIGDALERVAIPRGASVMVALSGGPDSVALMHAMLAMRERFGYRLAAAHLNHGIRGAESDRDEAFVRDLCARLGLDLVVERAAGLIAGTSNLEERARDTRHRFLNSAADRIGAEFIALAHHADDQAETVVLRLLRGAGAAGLAAMHERGPGRIIRPMLAVTRAEARAYLAAIGADFVVDSSNNSGAILRNRIRTDLLPMLEREYAPGLAGRLVELADEMRALDDFVAAEAQRELASMPASDALDLARLSAMHPALQAAVLREFLKRRVGSLRRVERVHIEALRRLCVDGPPNGTLNLPGHVRAIREYSTLRLSTIAPKQRSFMVRLNPVGVTEIPEAGFAFDAVVVPSRDALPPRDKFDALFDAEVAGERLTARNFRRGDRINPIGMVGQRKLKDIYIDAKLPKSKRLSFPVVELDGAIAWLPGMVRGQVALVAESTRSVVRLRARAILMIAKAPLRMIKLT